MLAHQGGEDKPRPPSWQNHVKDMWACDALAGHRPLLQLTGRPSSLSMCNPESSSNRCHPFSYRRLDRLYRCGRRLRMDDRRTISFVIVITSLDPVRARVAATSGIKMLTTPYHAKRSNAICERFLGSVRRECLDHLFIFGGEAAGSCPACLCPVLQSSQAASRHQTAASRTIW
jgi:hypothetical protein